MFIISFFLFNSKEVCYVHDSTVQKYVHNYKGGIAVKKRCELLLPNERRLRTHISSIPQIRFKCSRRSLALEYKKGGKNLSQRGIK